MNIMVTDKCNLSCKMCCFANKRTGAELSLYDFRYILDQLIDVNINGKKVTEIRLDGNREALLHPNIGSLISEAKKRGLKTRIVTNGVLLNENKAYELIQSGLDKLKISVTGAGIDIYKLYQGYNKSDEQFETVVKNITRFIELKEKYKSAVLVIICYLLTQESIHDVYKAIDYWRSTGGGGADGMFFTKLKKDIKWSNKFHFVGKIPKECINSMIITANGEIRPCCYAEHLDFSLGNIFKSNINEIMNSSLYYSFIENLSIGNRSPLPKGCKECSYLWREGEHIIENTNNYK